MISPVGSWPPDKNGPDFADPGSNGTVYKTDLDGAILSGKRLANAFAPHELNQPVVAFVAADVTFAADTIGKGTNDLLANDMAVKLTNDATDLPDPLVIGTTYWIVQITATTLKLSLTQGGAAIDLTDDGTGNSTIVPQPSMIVQIDAGGVYDVQNLVLTEAAKQTTITIVAPSVNPRIDRIVVDRADGTHSIVTGAEAASPVPPAFPFGTLPVCQVALATSTTAIDNTLITDERIATDAKLDSNTGIRQTVLAGEVDGNGYANFITDNGTGSLFLDLNATTGPSFVVAFANGFNKFGGSNFFHEITADLDTDNAWEIPDIAQTNYLYIDRDISTGVITFGTDDVQPVYGYVHPAHSEGAHSFLIPEMKMYQSLSSVWVQKQRVFCGQADGNGSLGVVAATTITYALRGEFISLLSTPATNTKFAYNHNIGAPILVLWEAVNNTADANYSPGDVQFILGGIGLSAGIMVVGSGTDFLTAFMNSAVATLQVPNKTTQANTTITASSWDIRLTAWRKF